jgi:hypothetical protein
MADKDNIQDNVTLLRPPGHAGREAERRQKAAERKRRSGARRKQSTPLVAPDQSVTRDPPLARDTPAVIKEAPVGRDSHVAADVTAAVIGVAPPKRDGVTISTLAAALVLAAVSGGFSIYGMTSIFVGATLPVIAMGVALEVGKLAAVAPRRRAAARPRRGAVAAGRGVGAKAGLTTTNFITLSSSDKYVTKVPEMTLGRSSKVYIPASRRREWRRPKTIRCRRCKKKVAVPPRGRVPEYCSASCRQRAYEHSKLHPLRMSKLLEQDIRKFFESAKQHRTANEWIESMKQSAADTGKNRRPPGTPLLPPGDDD